MNRIELRDDTGLVACFGIDGQLLEMSSEHGGWRFAASCWGWSLRTQWSDTTPGDLHPCHAGHVAQPDAQSLHVIIDRMRDDDGREVPVEIWLIWHLAHGLLQARIVQATLPPGLTPAALAFPDVRFPYGEEVQWVVPRDVGMILDDPCIEARDADGMPGCNRQRCHMQFTAWLEHGLGLYLDSRDSDGWMKSMLLRVGQGTARLCIEHLLPQPESGPPEFPAYCVSLAPFAGGWYEAARRYRSWALTQQWASRGPDERRDSYVADIACWLWNRGRIDNVVPATTEVARRLGLPVALDWYWWHKKPYDSGYPDYFPPREGDERFRAAVAELQRHQVAVQVYTNGMSWDRDEPDWETEGRESTLVLHDGNYHGVVYNTWMNRRLMHTCGAAEGWHRRALLTADNAAALGLDGLYMDQISIVGGQTPCFSRDHGHTPGGGAYGIQGYRELFRTIRERHPDLVLSSESVAEVYQDLLECCITLQTSWERGRGAAGCKGANPIPLFQAVYHGRAVVFGNYAHIDGITPYDELWPEEGRTDPADEQDWHRICPDQFALAVARTVAFGCQPLATNLTMQHLTDPGFEQDVAFLLDIARFYHAHREWLLWGEMLHPGTVHCGHVDVTCIHRSIFTRPASIEPFTVQRPAVLHSAWRSPDGEAGLVLINYTRDEQEVRVERPDGLGPEDGQTALTLPPRSMRFVSLTDAARRAE